ncbi:MAG: NAD-dependent epimerase/dehydratase family protein [Planctomycetaceae bacterium]|nr:NAD-dependent epimerase/dehydratase family protein [Planctomycetaceae bacterium]
MTQIDRTKPVLVTGATGYVAGWLVKRLLEDGLTVHAAVRDPDNAEKLKYLNAIAADSPGQIKYFASDLLQPGSYAAAMQDCELVYHTASPFTMSVQDPQRDLVDPAVKGTQNVLEQASQTPSVKRVVVTSSVVAIYGDNIDLQNSATGKFTEQDWNTTSTLEHNPYSFSKVQAEKEAWKIADAQQQWDLVTINPGLVIGPGINPHATSESFNLMKNFGNGRMRFGVPDYGVGLVDVRDVAAAHIKAGFTPTASGRYLTSGHNSSFPEMARPLRKAFGRRFPFPLFTSPKPLVWLFGPLLDSTLTRTSVSRNVGHPFVGDNSKSVQELGITYRPHDESIVEFFQQLVDTGAFGK